MREQGGAGHERVSPAFATAADHAGPDRKSRSPMTQRGQELSVSPFAWEREAFEYLRRRMPDREPFRAFSNCEFIADDGSINEIDLLLVGIRQVFVVEIKSRPGEVSGDTHSWTWTDAGRAVIQDNPLLLANRKARKLASALKREMSRSRKRTPYVQPIVFLSDPAQRCTLEEHARANVHLRDECESGGAGIVGGSSATIRKAANCASNVMSPRPCYAPSTRSDFALHRQAGGWATTGWSR